METQREQNGSTAPTPMGVVWLLVIINMTIMGGLFYVWHLWIMDVQRTQHTAALAELRDEADALSGYLASLTPLSGDTSAP